MNIRLIRINRELVESLDEGTGAFESRHSVTLGEVTGITPDGDGTVEIAYFTFPPFEGRVLRSGPRR